MNDFSKIIGIIEIECPRCGHTQSYRHIRTDSSAEFGECINCGELTFNKILNAAAAFSTSVECPYCHSRNTKKISALSKAGSVAFLGVFSLGKVAKQWHCNNCKSDF